MTGAGTGVLVTGVCAERAAGASRAKAKPERRAQMRIGFMVSWVS